MNVYDPSHSSDDKIPWYEGRWGREAMLGTSSDLKTVLQRNLAAKIVRQYSDVKMADEKKHADSKGPWYGNRWGRDEIGSMKLSDLTSENKIANWFSSPWQQKRSNMKRLLKNIKDIFE